MNKFEKLTDKQYYIRLDATVRDILDVVSYESINQIAGSIYLRYSSEEARNEVAEELENLGILDFSLGETTRQEFVNFYKEKNDDSLEESQKKFRYIDSSNSKKLAEQSIKPSINHTKYVLDNVLNWNRDWNFDKRSLKQIAQACAKYDDGYAADEYYKVIRDNDLLSRETSSSIYRTKEDTVFSKTLGPLFYVIKYYRFDRETWYIGEDSLVKDFDDAKIFESYSNAESEIDDFIDGLVLTNEIPSYEFDTWIEDEKKDYEEDYDKEEKKSSGLIDEYPAREYIKNLMKITGIYASKFEESKLRESEDLKKDYLQAVSDFIDSKLPQKKREEACADADFYATELMNAYPILRGKSRLQIAYWCKTGKLKEKKLRESEEESSREIPLRDGDVSGVVDSVLGQMSDGYWENSSSYDKYWKFAYVDHKNNILKISREILRSVKRPEWSPRYGKVYRTIVTQNAFISMSDDAIKRYFAQKAKYLIKEEGLEWSRNNQEETDWMDKRDEAGKRAPITVAEVYSAYDWLMGRDRGKITDTSEESKMKESYGPEPIIWNQDLYDYAKACATDAVEEYISDNDIALYDSEIDNVAEYVTNLFWKNEDMEESEEAVKAALEDEDVFDANIPYAIKEVVGDYILDDPIGTRDYLLRKEEVTALDKEEMFILQDLIQRYGKPDVFEESKNHVDRFADWYTYEIEDIFDEPSLSIKKVNKIIKKYLGEKPFTEKWTPREVFLALSEEGKAEVNDFLDSIVGREIEESQKNLLEKRARSAKGLDDNVKEWYTSDHFSDTGEQIKEDLTFRDLLMAIMEGNQDVQDILGTKDYDWIMNNQICTELANRIGVSPKSLTPFWLGESKMKESGHYSDPEGMKIYDIEANHEFGLVTCKIKDEWGVHKYFLKGFVKGAPKFTSDGNEAHTYSNDLALEKAAKKAKLYCISRELKLKKDAMDISQISLDLENKYLSLEDVDILKDIDLKINSEDYALFVEEIKDHLNLKDIKEVEYTEPISGYDGAYKVTLKDGSIKCFDWQDFVDEIVPREEDEYDKSLKESSLKEEYQSYDPSEWSDEDIELHKSIDWAARDYQEFPIPETEYEGNTYFYTEEGLQMVKEPYVKYIRPNAIYPPYFGPVDNTSTKKWTSAMYDGRSRGKYMIHDRRESWSVYKTMSEKEEGITVIVRDITPDTSELDSFFDVLPDILQMDGIEDDCVTYGYAGPTSIKVHFTDKDAAEIFANNINTEFFDVKMKDSDLLEESTMDDIYKYSVVLSGHNEDLNDYEKVLDRGLASINASYYDYFFTFDDPTHLRIAFKNEDDAKDYFEEIKNSEWPFTYETKGFQVEEEDDRDDDEESWENYSLFVFDDESEYNNFENLRGFTDYSTEDSCYAVFHAEDDESALAECRDEVSKKEVAVLCRRYAYNNHEPIFSKPENSKEWKDLREAENKLQEEQIALEGILKDNLEDLKDYFHVDFVPGKHPFNGIYLHGSKFIDHTNFSYRATERNGRIRVQIIENHPYDDADYDWAFCYDFVAHRDIWRIIDAGEIVVTLKVKHVGEVIEELRRRNAKISPRMMYESKRLTESFNNKVVIHCSDESILDSMFDVLPDILQEYEGDAHYGYENTTSFFVVFEDADEAERFAANIDTADGVTATLEHSFDESLESLDITDPKAVQELADFTSKTADDAKQVAAEAEELRKYIRDLNGPRKYRVGKKSFRSSEEAYAYQQSLDENDFEEKVLRSFK